MISRSNIFSIILFFLVSVGCSNSLTTRGEDQTVQTIDETFPEINDDLDVADNEDLSNESFDDFDSDNLNLDSAIDENSNFDIADEDLDNETLGGEIEEGSFEDFGDLGSEFNEDVDDSELESFYEDDSAVGQNQQVSSEPVDNDPLAEELNDEFIDEFESELENVDEKMALDDFEGELDGGDDDLAFEDFEDFEEPSENLVLDNSGKEDLFADFDEISEVDNLVVGNENTDYNFEDVFKEDLDSFSEDEVIAGDLPNKEVETTNDFADDDFLFDEESIDSNFVETDSNISDNIASEFNDVIDSPINDQIIETPSFANNTLNILEYNSSTRDGLIVLRASEPLEFNTQYEKSSSKFTMNISNLTVPSILQRPLYLKDFNQSFGAVKATPVGGGTVQVVVNLRANFEPNILTNGRSLFLSPGTENIAGQISKIDQSIALSTSTDVNSQISKNLNLVATASSPDGSLNASTLEEFLLETGRFYGDPINLQVNDEEIATVIGFIADYSGANIVIAPGVSGKVTLKLRNVPWDQALLTIMKTRNLGYVRNGNVLRIAPLADLQKEAEAAVAVQKSQMQVEPMLLKVIPLEYAKGDQILAQILPFKTERGVISQDARTSSIVINDTKDVIAKVKNLIKELDLPPPQVLVEAKIVEATKTFSRSLGIRWGFSGANTQLSPTGGANNQPISINPTLAINNTQAARGITANQPFSADVRIGTLDFLGALDAAIGLSETEEQVKVISSPRVTTLNNQEATILQSSEIIRVSNVITNGVSQSIPVAVPLELELKVTPQITSGASVLLDIDIKNEFPGQEIGGFSPKNSRQAKAKVLVGTNKTAVIGGIYDKSSTTFNTGVPLLKDIPFLGWLFKTKTTEKRDSEIMIFITPRILDKNYESPATSNAY